MVNKLHLSLREINLLPLNNSCGLFKVMSLYTPQYSKTPTNSPTRVLSKGFYKAWAWALTDELETYHEPMLIQKGFDQILLNTL